MEASICQLLPDLPHLPSAERVLLPSLATCPFAHPQDVDSTCAILIDGQELRKGQRTQLKPGCLIDMGAVRLVGLPWGVVCAWSCTAAVPAALSRCLLCC